MARTKKSTKAQKSNELDGKEFFAALELIEKEKGIPKSYMIDKIGQALISAYKRDHDIAPENVDIRADEERGLVQVFIKKEVLPEDMEVTNPATQISLEVARQQLPNVMPYDTVRIEIKPRDFGRIAAQTAKQVIIQGMREAEHSKVYDVFSTKEHEMLIGTVSRIDQRGTVVVRLNVDGESIDAFLSEKEQVSGEIMHEGDRVRVYVVEVRRTSRGPQVVISRTHPGLVKRLFELQVPELYDGTVEIRAVAREAGSRSKIAVWSADENVDPIGACVGPKGERVNSVVDELCNEKIDIIKYSDDPAEFVKAALSPSGVVFVTPLEGTKSCRVAVPDDQLSLAIGKEGQNARLAARLTGYKIDIKAESAVHEWEEEDAAAAAAAELEAAMDDEPAPEEAPAEAEAAEE